MEEVIFLFLYHEMSEATLRHYRLLQQHHPRDQIIPLAYQLKARESLPDTVDLALDWDYGWPIFNVWHENDKVYLRWFLKPNRPVARRYVFFEWDIRVQSSAQSFYRNTWDADVAATIIKTPETDKAWHWWKQLPLLHASAASACGIVPLGSSLWSHATLTYISERRDVQHCFCELRMGTLARLGGFRPMIIPSAATTISWQASDIVLTDAQTWFHPVKA